MTKDAKNEQAKAPLPMESFFTRENANEGIELPLLLPDGIKTEHWLRIRGVDADGFRKAEARSKRKMLEIAAEKDLDKRDAEVEDTRLAMLAALVIGWSFDTPCTEAEIKRLFREAPQIAEQVDRTAYDRARFFGNSSKGSPPSRTLVFGIPPLPFLLDARPEIDSAPKKTSRDTAASRLVFAV